MFARDALRARDGDPTVGVPVLCAGSPNVVRWTATQASTLEPRCACRYGGCGDISRNVMTPPVTFPNNPAYEYCGQYARAMAELFKPMTQAFYEIWLDGQPADKTEYWQRDIGKAGS